MTDIRARDGGKRLLALVKEEVPFEAIGPQEEASIRSFVAASETSKITAIESKVLGGKFRQARRAANAYRGSLAARASAAIQSLPREINSAPAEIKWSEIVGCMNALRQFDRPAQARVYAKAKRQNVSLVAKRYRQIFQFGWHDLARQRLIKHSLQPFVGFHPSQYLLRRGMFGRGRSGACEALLHTLPLLGEDYVFVQLDVRSFHATINHGWLEKALPLPLDIIRSHVHTGGMAIAPLRNNVRARLGGAIELLSRQGIPQGSALSSLIGEFVIAEVLRGLSDRFANPLLYAVHHNLHTYSDNLGIFVKRKEAAAIVDLLTEAFASTPAGPFQFRAAPPMPVHEPFRFLGYWFEKAGRAARVFVPHDLAHSRVDAILADLLTAGPAEFQRMRRSLNGLSAEWKRCDAASSVIQSGFARISSAEEALSFTEHAA